jgi:hypothetical protein
MTLPYETATAGERALGELKKTLEKFGCQSFGSMVDVERGVTIVQFKHQGRVVSLEANWKGYAALLLKHSRRTQEKAIEQARKSVCSVLRDWVKAQITAVEAGVMSFEAVFMPHMLLPSGERLIDKVKADNLLPAPETKQ